MAIRLRPTPRPRPALDDRQRGRASIDLTTFRSCNEPVTPGRIDHPGSFDHMLPVWTFTPDAPPRVEFLCTSGRKPEEDVDPCLRCDFGEHLFEPSAIRVMPGGLSPEGFRARIAVGPENGVSQIWIQSGCIDRLEGPKFVQHASSGRRNGHGEGASDRCRGAHQSHSVAPTGKQCRSGAARGAGAKNDDVDLVQF